MATYLIGHVKGAKGDKGDTGSAAGFGTPTASVDANVGTPSVTVTATGPDTAKAFDFAFHNMKGAKGDKGDKGDTGNTGAAAGFGTPTASVDSNTGTPSVSITSSGSDTSKVFDFQFHNLKGETGATGPTGPTGPADTTALNIVRSTSTDAYKTTKSYKVGDHVIYNNTLYRCKTACSAASWSTNQSNFESTTLTKAVTDLNASLTQFKTPELLFDRSDIKNTTTEYSFDNSYNVYMVVVASANVHRIQHLCFKSQTIGQLNLVGYNISTAQALSVFVNFNTGKLKGATINSYEQQYGCHVWIYGIM